MIFEVIPNQQTPRVPDIEDIELFFIQNIKTLVAFKEYAESRYDAAGLAANQCSVDGERLMLRVFAFKLLNAVTNEPLWRLIINPEVIECIGMKEIKAEGCLTWKGKVVVAERSRAVKVKYYNEIGEPVTETYTGFASQVWQHEINHLNGVEEQIEEYEYINKIPKRKDVGRNDPCPCNSGKKYKHCCLLYL
jgi:peptide deformylase